MAREYKGADEALRHDEDLPFDERSFMLLLLDSPLVEFEEKQTSVDGVLKHERNAEKARFALRTQVISDPTRPIGGTAEVLQLFMEDPNHDEALRGGHAGVIYEQVQGADLADLPLFLLTQAEVDRLVYGEGYATPLRT